MTPSNGEYDPVFSEKEPEDDIHEYFQAAANHILKVTAEKNAINISPMWVDNFLDQLGFNFEQGNKVLEHARKHGIRCIHWTPAYRGQISLSVRFENVGGPKGSYQPCNQPATLIYGGERSK